MVRVRASGPLSSQRRQLGADRDHGDDDGDGGSAKRGNGRLDDNDDERTTSGDRSGGDDGGGVGGRAGDIDGRAAGEDRRAGGDNSSTSNDGGRGADESGRGSDGKRQAGNDGRRTGADDGPTGGVTFFPGLENACRRRLHDLSASEQAADCFALVDVADGPSAACFAVGAARVGRGQRLDEVRGTPSRTDPSSSGGPVGPVLMTDACGKTGPTQGSRGRHPGTGDNWSSPFLPLHLIPSFPKSGIVRLVVIPT